MTYAKAWILAEQRPGAVWNLTVFELAAAARSVASNVEAITWGSGEPDYGLLGDHGITAVHKIDIGDQQPSMPVSAAISSALTAAGADGPDLVLAATSYDGRDILGRLSARIDRTILSNAIGLALKEDSLVVHSAIFGGRTVVESRFDGPAPHLVLVRPKAFVPEIAGGGGPAIHSLDAVVAGVSARVVSSFSEDRTGPALDEASVVVAGGRGLGSAEAFELVEKLAEILHGAPAATRAIVDAGWVPYSYQVGQTGTTVKPTVYIACGISGATQHIVGMKGVQHIIAINKDLDAPIFSIADLGIVGDVTKVLPQLIAALEAL